MGEYPESSDLSRDEFIEAFVAWAERHEASHRCFVAERDGVVIGMTWLAITARVPSPRAVHRLSGDVQAVYVVPGERNAGIGGGLIAELISTANELGIERVTVHSSGGAVSAYERAGFEASRKLLERYLDSAVR